MKYSLRNIYIFVSILGFLVLGFVFSEIEKQRVALQEGFLKKEINSLSDMFGKEYILDKGLNAKARHYTLSYFWLLEQFDPIFALDGTEDLSGVVSDSTDSVEEIASYYGDDSQSHISATLYPLNFLSLLSQLQAARSIFFEEPTFARLEDYYSLLEEVAVVRGEEIKIAERNFESNLEDMISKDQHFRFLNGVTAPEALLSMLEDLSYQNTRMREQIEERVRCLSGDTEKCPHLKGALLSLTEITTQGIESNADDFEKNDWEGNKDLLDRLFNLEHQLGEFAGVHEETPQVVSLVRSQCLSKYAPSHFYVYIPEATARSAFSEGRVQVTNVDELYFERTPLDPKEGTMQQVLFDSDIQYRFQDFTNTYLCPDSGGDLSDIFTLWYLDSEIRSIRPFSSLDERRRYSDRVATLTALEERLLEEKIVSETLVTEYMKNLAMLVREGSEQDSLMNVPLSTVLTWLRAYQNKTGFYDQVLSRVLTDNSAVRVYGDFGIGIPINSLYLNRSNPRIMLFGYNKSFTSTHIPTPIMFHDEYFYLGEYFPYSALGEEGVSVDVLEQEFNKYQDL